MVYGILVYLMIHLTQSKHMMLFFSLDSIDRFIEGTKIPFMKNLFHFESHGNFIHSIFGLDVSIYVVVLFSFG